MEKRRSSPVPDAGLGAQSRSVMPRRGREWSSPAAQTDALTASQNANPTRESARHTPLGRLGDPRKDIAPVALFLASRESDFVTGMTMMAGGGLLIGP